MGGEHIVDGELQALGVAIEGKTDSGHRKLKVPKESLSQYTALVKKKLMTYIKFCSCIIGI